MAISNATVVPKIIAAQMLLPFRQAITFASRTNNTWRSQLNAGGNEVIINTPAAASVADYSANDTITYTNADVGDAISLTLGKVKHWAIKFDDLNAALSSLPVLQSSVTEHGIALANQVDADVRAAMDTGATAGPALAFDHSKTLSFESLKLPQLHRVMDLQRVPKRGRFLIVGPYTAEVISKVAIANDQVLASGNMNNLVNGRLGSFAGFDIVVADPTHSTYKSADKSATETAFFGVNSATAFIDRIRKTERLRLQSTFADAVRGLYEYGVKVIDGKRIFKSAVTITKVPA